MARCLVLKNDVLGRDISYWELKNKLISKIAVLQELCQGFLEALDGKSLAELEKDG